MGGRDDVMLGTPTSTGLSDAKACRNGSLAAGSACRGCAARSAVATASLSFFASRLAETPSAIAAAIDAGPGNCTDGTLFRVRILAAAAPTTMKHPSVRRIIVLVNRISAPFDKAAHRIPKNGDLIVAWKSRAAKNARSIERNGGIQRRPQHNRHICRAASPALRR